MQSACQRLAWVAAHQPDGLPAITNRGATLFASLLKVNVRLRQFFLLFTAFWLLACGGKQHPVSIPYDRTNPVVYDNDDAIDTYADEYVLALASLGEIQLKGMMTSSSVAPYNKWVTADYYERCVEVRKEIARVARASGFRNVPEPVPGPKGNLEQPASGRVEDTKPIDCEGSRLIVAEAKKATAEKPLVVVIGGPLTAEASAYLLDPSIADRMIVAWFGGLHTNMGGYNGWADAWATYVVLQKLRLVQFGPVAMAYVPKKRFLDLPPSALRDFMYAAHHPTNNLPGDYEGDGTPAIAMMRRDYTLRTRAATFDQWVVDSPQDDPHKVPGFRVNLFLRAKWHFFPQAPASRSTVVTATDGRVATEEFWRAMEAALSR